MTKKAVKPKSNEDKFKLLFSSLFARKMNNAIFTKQQNDTEISNNIIFTNISMDEAIIYEPNTKQFIHTVKLKDMEFVKWFFESFPVLKEHNCFLDIRKFMSTYNKIKKDKAQLVETDGVLFMTGDKLNVECGYLITDDTVALYDNILLGIDKHLDWAYLKDFQPDVMKDNLQVMEVHVEEDSDMIDKKFKLYLSQGEDLPHVQEFYKKYKEPIYLKLLTLINNKALRVKYEMLSDFVDVVSVCPAMFWFPRLITTLRDKE